MKVGSSCTEMNILKVKGLKYNKVESSGTKMIFKFKFY